MATPRPNPAGDAVAPAAPPLSEEQALAVARAEEGRDGRIVARAGSGKTSTLLALARRMEGRASLYLAFNRSIAQEARGRFPPHVRVTTLHALAFREVVRPSAAYRGKFERGGGKLDTPTLRRLAGLDPAARPGRAAPRAPGAARHVVHVRATLAAFCASADERVTPRHVPDAVRSALALDLPPDRLADRLRWLARRAQRVWQAVADPEHEAPLDFDAFLKLYQLRRPRLPGELLLIDEAQDLNPVMLTLLAEQSSQRVLVGDPQQQIYAWRGAVDALAAFPFPEVQLTYSFRFGEAIAGVARRVLAVATRRGALVGAGPEGRVCTATPPGDEPRAVLCRTHAGLVEAGLEAAARGMHVIGGIEELTAPLRAVYALRCGRSATHPALHGARTWSELVELAETLGGSLRTLHRLAERYGARLPSVWATLERSQRRSEREAAVVLSTLHKAKGREWDEVELWRDLPRVPHTRAALAAAPDPDAMRAELHLLYVGVTRARRTLYVGRIPDEARALLLGARSD